jgi:hypothetical protein
MTGANVRQGFSQDRLAGERIPFFLIKKRMYEQVPASLFDFFGTSLPFCDGDWFQRVREGKDPLMSRPAPPVINPGASERIVDLETVPEEVAWQNFERLAAFN